MLRGAEVFPNIGCDGKTDICFKYMGSIYEIDVKLARLIKKTSGSCSWGTTTARLVRLPVYPLIVVPITGVDMSGWYCKWVGLRTGANPPPHCPPGLENFWD